MDTDQILQRIKHSTMYKWRNVGISIWFDHEINENHDFSL